MKKRFTAIFIIQDFDLKILVFRKKYPNYVTKYLKYWRNKCITYQIFEVLL